MALITSDDSMTWWETVSESPLFRDRVRVLSALAGAALVCYVVYGTAPAPPRPELEPWIRYARPGDKVWDTFYVIGVNPRQELVDVGSKGPVFATYHEIELAPVASPNMALKFRMPVERKRLVQWRRQFRFQVEVIQDDVIKLDRQNVEQLVSY